LCGALLSADTLPGALPEPASAVRQLGEVDMQACVRLLSRH